jgi:hypothetical protein
MAGYNGTSPSGVADSSERVSDREDVVVSMSSVRPWAWKVILAMGGLVTIVGIVNAWLVWFPEHPHEPAYSLREQLTLLQTPAILIGIGLTTSALAILLDVLTEAAKDVRTDDPAAQRQAHDEADGSHPPVPPE